MQKTAQQIRKSLSNFPSDPTVVWGGSFPFEAVYPVLAPNLAATDYRLYCLGCFTLAPFSTVFAEKQAGRGMLKRLVSRVGVPIVASQQRLNFLKIYCKTRLHGQLQTLSVTNYGLLTINQQQCEIEQ